jgi:hypothetical protein
MSDDELDREDDRIVAKTTRPDAHGNRCNKCEIDASPHRDPYCAPSRCRNGVVPHDLQEVPHDEDHCHCPRVGRCLIPRTTFACSPDLSGTSIKV